MSTRHTEGSPAAGPTPDVTGDQVSQAILKAVRFFDLDMGQVGARAGIQDAVLNHRLQDGGWSTVEVTSVARALGLKHSALIEIAAEIGGARR